MPLAQVLVTFGGALMGGQETDPLALLYARLAQYLDPDEPDPDQPEPEDELDDDDQEQLRDAFQTMLAQDNRQSLVFVQLAQCKKDIFSSLRVELGGGLVQHQDFRLQRQDCSNCHALLFSPRQRADPPLSQLRDAHLIQHFLDAFAHGGRRQGKVLHGKGQLILDRVDDKLGFRILKNEADEIGHASRGQVDRIPAANLNAPCPAPSVEMRRKAIQAAQERRFARAGWTNNQYELALGNGDAKIGQGGLRLVRIVVGDM